MFSHRALALSLVLLVFDWAAAVPPTAVQLHNAAVHDIVVRSLHDAKLQDRDTLQNSMPFGRSWDGAVLMKLPLTQKPKPNASVTFTESIEIVCTKCYVQGVARSRINIPDNFNATYALQQTVDAVGHTIKNITNTAEHEIKSYYETNVEHHFLTYFEGLAKDVLDDLPLPFPRMNLSFDVDLSSIPQVTLDFEFDDLEVYAQLDTTLDAGLTYTLNLYTSNTPLGFGLGKQKLGVNFLVDLIISADAAIDISSGFHIKFDSLGLNMALFNHSVAHLVHNGGRFETLPVTVESGDVTFTASLRLGMTAGLKIAVPDEVPSFTVFNTTVGFDVGGGISTSIYATVVELISKIAYVADDHECKFKAVQQYQFNLGGAAGATVYADAHTWGPHVTKEIAVHTKTLDQRCVLQAKSTGAPLTSKAKRANLSTATKVTTITHTAVQCLSTIAGNCPASQQVTSKTSDIITLTTAVSSGATVTWPATPGVINSVLSTVPFQQGAFSISPTSGVPTAYTPLATQIVNDIENHVDSALNVIQNNKLTFGLSIGLGVPAVIAAIVAVCCLARRRKRRMTIAMGQPQLTNEMQSVYEPANKTVKSVVQVQEVEQ